LGTKAQGELLRHEALHQTFRIRKVFLSATGPAIRLRLCEVERPADRARALARPALRPPVQLQRFPDRTPILRGRFHDDFFDLALDQPVGQRAQVGGARPDLLAIELKVPSTSTSATTTANIFLCTSIPAIRYGIGLSWGSGERASSHQSGSRAVVGFTCGRNDAQSFDQSRTLRIKQLLGLDGSTGSIRSRRSRRRHSDPRPIFMSFRGLQAQG
jgi:hypothetical protein